MITQATRIGAYEVVRGHRAGRWLLDEEQQEILADAAIRRFADYAFDLPPGPPPKRLLAREIKADPEVKKFIPIFILTAIGSWLIGKLLDYLWGKWETARTTGKASY